MERMSSRVFIDWTIAPTSVASAVRTAATAKPKFDHRSTFTAPTSLRVCGFENALVVGIGELSVGTRRGAANTLT